MRTNGFELFDNSLDQRNLDFTIFDVFQELVLFWFTASNGHQPNIDLIVSNPVYFQKMTECFIL